MRNFNLGEKVVALTNPKHGASSQPRVKGGIYTIKALNYCCNCGVQRVNIGPKTSEPDAEIICGCGKIQGNKGLHLTDHYHFAPLENIESEIERAVKNEDYELAAILRDTNLVLL